MRDLIFLIFIIIPGMAWSAAAAGGEASIPWDTIKLQVLNFGVFFVIIALLIKIKINPILENMKTEYLSKANEAQKKLEAAKKERDELKEKILNIENQYVKSIEEAKKEADERKKQSILNAKEMVTQLNKDLDRQVEALKQSYTNSIKSELVNASITELKRDLDEDFDEASFNQLQKNFVERMDVRL